MAEVPPSRASDYSLCLSNPFQYYLTRRLGLVPMLSWSEALSAGTWMHERARYFFQSFPNGDLPAELNTELQNQLDDRLTELRAACNTLSISPARENEILEDERRAYALGRAIFEAAITFQFPSGETLLSKFQAPNRYRIALCEKKLTVTHPKHGEVCCQPDLLLAEMTGNRCWIIDWKSTGDTALNRLRACRTEQATYLYPYVVSEYLKNNELPYLSKGASVGGIIHVAIEKPGIRLSGEDRDFTIKDFTPRSGPNKGITRQEKEYHGEPTFPNYLRRVTDWIHGSGTYTHERPARVAAPPVNISTIYMNGISRDEWERFDRRLSLNHHYAKCRAYPINFPDNVGQLVAGDIPSAYHPFYHLPPARWPEVVVDSKLIVARREDGH